MPAQPKILLLDDDPEFLELYQDLLAKLPSRPEIRTAASGARAIAMLEAEPFSLLLTDLHMPHMDGLQVLSIVRRKFPQLRAAVLTGLPDEQFRVRAYAMGLDLYLTKPTTTQETKLVMDCIESLLGPEQQTGFRGMQSKSLVDIIQLECLCRSSTVLKVTNGLQEAKIWFQNGDIIDAAAEEFSGEAAFRKILAWKTGSFEILPTEPDHTRTIFNSYQGLLLESAQALDEAQEKTTAPAIGTGEAASTLAPAKNLARFKGVEFSLVLRAGEKQPEECWAVENPEAFGRWIEDTLGLYRAIGEDLKVGPVSQVVACGFQQQVVVGTTQNRTFGIGFQRDLRPAELQDTFKKILAQWES